MRGDDRLGWARFAGLRLAGFFLAVIGPKRNPPLRGWRSSPPVLVVGVLTPWAPSPFGRGERASGSPGLHAIGLCSALTFLRSHLHEAVASRCAVRSLFVAPARRAGDAQSRRGARRARQVPESRRGPG